jgi:hypothetical protein
MYCVLGGSDYCQNRKAHVLKFTSLAPPPPNSNPENQRTNAFLVPMTPFLDIIASHPSKISLKSWYWRGCHASAPQIVVDRVMRLQIGVFMHAGLVDWWLSMAYFSEHVRTCVVENDDDIDWIMYFLDATSVFLIKVLEYKILSHSFS